MSINVTMGGKLLFPSEYLCAADLQGRDAVATIERVEAADLRTTDGKTTRKFLVFFKGKNKKLVLNKTNARNIGLVCGGAVEGWKGKQIILYPTTCQSFGKTTDCVRVRDRSPNEPQPRPVPLDGGFSDESDEPGAGPQAAAPAESDDSPAPVTSSTGEDDDQRTPELPPIPADHEGLVDAVARLCGLEMDVAEKKLKLQLPKTWDKTSEPTRAAWWGRFCGGQVAGLVPQLSK